MGYRYSDREIEILKRIEVLREARRMARLGYAPIDPASDDYEAIDFLYNLKMNFDDIVGERDLSMNPFDRDIAYEISEDSVPYNNYKAAMAYAQLGLYSYDELDGDQSYAGDQIGTIRYALFTLSNNIVDALLDDF
jgi:hypothetical protein